MDAAGKVIDLLESPGSQKGAVRAMRLRIERAVFLHQMRDAVAREDKPSIWAINIQYRWWRQKNGYIEKEDLI